MRNRFGFQKVAGVVLALSAVLVLAGCGQQGPPRYRISGRVTYGGQPIPGGSVTFIPTAGNTGPATSVTITNGQYDTALQETGHIGGSHLVKITGLDGKSDDLFPLGQPLFPDYEFKTPYDLPKEEGTQDFEVPADWKAPARPAAAQPTA